MERVHDSTTTAPHLFPCPTPPKDILLSWAGRWRDAIDARGRQAEFVRERHMQVLWVLERTGHQVEEDLVQRAIKAKADEGASARTCGKYLQAIKSFSKWLASPKRRVLAFDPLSDLRPPNAKRDRRHVRTSFWPVLGKLLETTAASTRSFQGIPGVDRAELYHAAACTGLREGTLAVVEAGQFDFAGPTATVSVRADQVKDGEDLVVPIQADSAARLAAYLAGRMPHVRAFRTPRGDTDFVRMLRKDLAEAGIPYCRRVKLPNGRTRREDVLDFHALRGTFGTWCAAAGVELTTTQRWMGHSDPALTANLYTKRLPAAEVAAVLKLPPLPGVLRAS